MKSRPFGRPKKNRWVRRYTHKRYRCRIGLILREFTIRHNDFMVDINDDYILNPYFNEEDYYYELCDAEYIPNPQVKEYLEEPHFPLWKDINDPWYWD
jgi:hypothetical protein